MVAKNHGTLYRCVTLKGSLELSRQLLREGPLPGAYILPSLSLSAPRASELKDLDLLVAITNHFTSGGDNSSCNFSLQISFV